MCSIVASLTPLRLRDAEVAHVVQTNLGTDADSTASDLEKVGAIDILKYDGRPLIGRDGNDADIRDVDVLCVPNEKSLRRHRRRTLRGQDMQPPSPGV